MLNRLSMRLATIEMISVVKGSAEHTANMGQMRREQERENM